MSDNHSWYFCGISLLARDINEHCYSYLNKYIGDIFKSICNIIAENEDNGDYLKYGNKILIDGVPEECTHLLLTQCVEYINKSSLQVPDRNKIVALSLLSAFVKQTKNDFDDNLPRLISGVLQLFNNENSEIRMAAWNALKDIMSTIPDSEIAAHIDWFRQCINNVTENNDGIDRIEGFCIKQGMFLFIICRDSNICTISNPYNVCIDF